MARHVGRETLDRGERILHFVRESRRHSLERTGTVLVFAAQLLAPLAQLEGGALVAARHGATDSVDADHRVEARDQRDGDVFGGGPPASCGQRRREQSRRRASENGQRDETRDKREKGGSAEPGRIAQRERPHDEQDGSHHEQGARQPAGRPDEDEVAHGADEKTAHLGRDMLGDRPHHERDANQRDRDHLREGARPRFATSDEQRDDHHEHGKLPGEPPAGGTLPHFVEHPPAQRIEAGALLKLTRGRLARCRRHSQGSQQIPCASASLRCRTSCAVAGPEGCPNADR